MNRLLKTTFIVSLIFGFHPTLKAQNPEDVTNGWKTTVENILPNLLNASANQFEGLAISFVYGDSSWTTSVGQANDTGLAIDPNGKWLFRSYTKLMVSTIILQLYEEGQLDIADSISEYLDPITNVNMSDSIDDLLQMRSRMCAYINSTNSVVDKIDQDRSAVLDTRTMLEEHLPVGPCNEEKAYDYNDANFQVLGLIIEAVTGKSGEEVFNERIIEPYSLESTALAPLDVERNQFNGLYRSVKNANEEITTTDDSMESLNSLLTSQKFNGGIMGSTSDMINYTKALLDSTVLDNTTLNLMKADPNTDGYGRGLMIQEMKGELGGYTFDFDTLYPGKYYGHGGAAWNTSRTFYDPERKLGFSFAFNSSTPSFDAVFNAEKFKENMYRLMRMCFDDGGCDIINSSELNELIPNLDSELFVTKDPNVSVGVRITWDGIDYNKAGQDSSILSYHIYRKIWESGQEFELLTKIKDDDRSTFEFKDRTTYSDTNYVYIVVPFNKQIQEEGDWNYHLTNNSIVARPNNPHLLPKFYEGESMEYTYQVSINSGFLANETYSGSFSFRVPQDSIGFTGAILVDTLEFNFRERVLTILDMDYHPFIRIEQNTFSGLYMVGGSIDERFGINDGFYDYQVPNGYNEYFGYLNEFTGVEGFGDITYSDGSVHNELWGEMIDEYSLSQNYPNPFNPSTNISFELPEAGDVQLKVFNLLGQEVANLIDDRLNSGQHAVNFNASELSSGVYIYRLIAGNQSITKKMMLIK